MTFPEWTELSRRDPAAAARRVLSNAAKLAPDQRRAVFADLSTAEALTRELARQTAKDGPLAGVPYVLKDLFPVKGRTLGAGGAFLGDVRPPESKDSALVRDFAELGATLAGITHLYEFAYGLTGENVHHGDVSHPHFPDRTSGGSSSGSAAAVAAGVVPLAVGTDTGGSIRVPAAFCGIYGLRLTPHHRWINDGFPLAPSFDTAGWFTQTASDMLTTLGALIGRRTSTRPLRGVSLGFDGWADAEHDVAREYARHSRRLAEPADDATRQEVLHTFTGCAQAYAVLQSLEAYEVHRSWLDERRASYSPEVWTRIDRARQWTDAQKEEAHVKRAAVDLLWRRFFLSYDFMVAPATPFPALRKAECTLENRNQLLRLTTPASLGGLPVLTLPFTLPNGLSSGLQIIVNSPESPVLDTVLRAFAA